MDAHPTTTRWNANRLGRRAWILLLLTAVVGGCARLPRIDPSGERIFLPANQAPPVVAPLGPTAPGFNTPGTFVSPPGNVTAPPAFAQGQSSGLLGLGVLGQGGAIDRAVNGPTVIGPAVGPPQPGTPVPAPSLAAQQAGPLRSRLGSCDCLSDRVSGDRVVITPQRVLAPVGTEVIVRAGVCGEDGYLKTNRRIDWLLAKQGSGEFVQVGEDGERDIARFPWRTPKKLDNNYAVGYTSPFHTCLRRGNVDPLDDIQVRKGDAWITVTSASEGTSYITAAAKSVDNWDTRRASTTIYWVDAQWQFPPSVSVPAGQPHTLTTTVTRQSDGAPVAGWIVRYEVQDPNAARLGYDAGEASEVTTDGQGRASVELTPTDTAAGTTTVNITVIRPEQSGVGASPRIDVGRGSTTINWGGAAGATPPPVLPPVDSTPLDRPQPDFLPPNNPPPAPPQPAGRPQLEVTLRQLTPDPIKVGDKVAFEVLVQNRGNAPARNLMITDRFDHGLANEFDTENKNEIEYPGMSDLGPNDSDSIRLEFTVLEPNRRSHQVTVSADGPQGRVESFDQASFTALPIAPTAPTLDVRFVRPTPVRATKGDKTTLRAIVENTGTTVATNVVARLRTDALALQVTGYGTARPDRGESQRNYNEGSVQVLEFTFPRLAPGEKTSVLEFECNPVRATDRHCVTFEATADGGGDQITEACLEILPAPPAIPGAGGLTPGASPQAGAPLQIEISDTSNPTFVGRTLQINVRITNTGTAPLRNVQVQTLIPPQQFRVQPNSVSPTNFTPFQDGTIEFAPIELLQPTEETSVLLTVQATGQGVARVSATARSAEFPAGLTQTRDITVNARQ